MNDVTTRFLDTYEYLRKTKVIQNPKTFAEELGVSSSLITEICKMRTNAGITPVQNLVKRFTNIDANWLLTGEGSMLKNQNTVTHSNFKKLAEARLEIIERKNEKITAIIKELESIKNF